MGKVLAFSFFGRCLISTWQCAMREHGFIPGWTTTHHDFGRMMTMMVTKLSSRLALFLAMTGLCLPTQVLAADPAPPSPAVVDVALGDGGVLQGLAVDPQGAPKADLAVALRSGDQELGAAKTDQAGRFAFSGLRGGVYQLATAESQGVVRVWAPRTAPPYAQQGVMLVSGESVVRGQAFRNIGSFASHPWVMAGIIATAVAVPIAIHNANRDDPVSP